MIWAAPVVAVAVGTPAATTPGVPFFFTVLIVEPFEYDVRARTLTADLPGFGVASVVIT